MKRKNIWKVALAFAVALAFVLPGAAAFASIGTFGVTTNLENTDTINNVEDGEGLIDTSDVVEDAVLGSGGIIYVGSGSGNDSTTIQGGIDLANPGDTVYVYNGIYTECDILVDKPLNLVGESKEGVIVDSTNTSYSFQFAQVSNTSISNFTMKNGMVGIWVDSKGTEQEHPDSENINITNCIIHDNQYYGIMTMGGFGYMTKSIIKNCEIYNNWYGITLGNFREDNIILECNLHDNDIGIHMAGNVCYNYIYHNNFIDNIQNVDPMYGPCAVWDDGYPSGGNYWDDYTGVDANNDGIGDTPYVLDEDEQDNYPLMDPWGTSPEDNIIYVGSGPNNDSATIQGGIDLAEPGYTVYVYNGTYIECNIIVNKSLNLVGESKEGVIVNSTGTGFYYSFKFVQVSNTNISNFTMKNGQVGIWVDYETSDVEHINITNCISHDNEYYGIYTGGTNAKLRNSVIKNCEAYNALDGMHLSEIMDSTILECYCHDNDCGIYMMGNSADNHIYHNNLINNTRNAYDNAWSQTWDNGYPSGGNYWSDFDEPSEGAWDNDSDGIVDSPYFIEEDDVDNYPLMYPWGMILPPVHNLDTDLYYATIQEAIDAIETLNGHTIYVNNGIYYENVTVNKSINLIGESKEGTIIDGSNGTTEKILYVIVDNVNVSDFTIRNGKYGALFYPSNYSSITNCIGNNIMYGIYLRECKYSQVSDCISYGNEKYGIHVRGSYGSNANYNIVTNCICYDNEAGIRISETLYSTVTNCNSYNNEYGIRTENMAGDNEIYHNNFFDNSVKDAYQGTGDWVQIWDNGYPSGGNYYSDYIGMDDYYGPNQDILGSDGIGDTAYLILEGTTPLYDNWDYYPLMYPWGTPPEITGVTATPESQTAGGNVNITCTVEDIHNGVKPAVVYITDPNNNQQGFEMTGIDLDYLGNGEYCYDATYSLVGIYNYFIEAENWRDCGNESDTYQFEISQIGDEILWEYSTGYCADADRLEISGNTLICDSWADHVVEVTMGGTAVWEYPIAEPYDADRLESDNTLITEGANNYIIEVTSGGATVWEYSTGLNGPYDADRLEISGNTLITDTFNNRIIEVTSGGDIIWEYSNGLNCPIDADRLEISGNTLITDCLNNRIIEVTSGGNIVWEYSTGLTYPMDADRLEISGNTLIADTFNNRIIEVTSGGDIIWEYSNGLNCPFDADRLENGNTLIVDTENHRIIEVGIPQEQCTLTINIVGSGTTTPAEGVHSYPCGTVVDLEAFPDTCYEFAGWSGDINTMDNPTTITMDGDKAVTATFTEIYYELTISIVGSGTTTPAEGVHSYPCGTVVDLEAFPESGWEFVGWSGDINTGENPTTITMDGDKMVTATFNEFSCTLTISIVGSGTTIPAEGIHSYPCGTVVDLEAFPDTCWEFDAWSGDINTGENPTTITMDGDKAVTATFTEIYYELTMSIVGSGTTIPAEGVHSYPCGTVVDLEAFPDICWEFDAWSGDINTGENPTTITMDGDKAVTATFILIEDITPPVTTHEFAPSAPNGENNWYVSDVVITLDATDDQSGVEFTYYKLDAGDPYEEYDGPITVSGDGEYELWYYSVDYAENKEDDKGPFDFKIDQTAPVTTCELEGDGSVIVTLTATDETSGVNYTMYKLDDGTYSEYEEPIVVDEEGEHTVFFYSVDNAGNVEEEKSCTFTVTAELTIEISGGLGVTATIKNVGDVDITDVEWSITLDGGLILIGKEKTGTVDILAGDEVVVKSTIFGLGRTTITATANDIEETANGFVLLFFVLGV